MGGGLMQLVAYGAQDIYLTGNPQITFFKVVYRRHTNFSMEAVAQTFSGNQAAGARVSSTIARNGDLISKMYYEFNPQLLTVAGGAPLAGNIGHALFNEITLEIGGQVIDKHYGHWLTVWSELTDPNPEGIKLRLATDGGGTTTGAVPNIAGTVNGFFTKYQNMSYNFAGTTLNDGNITNAAVNVAAGGGFGGAPVHASIPLQFWFNRNPGLALPLIALQYHEVKINITFSGAAAISVNGGFGPDPTGQLWVDYIYLDTDERRRFAQQSHEYLIEQLQFEQTPALANAQLNFNHPVKELIWTGVPGANSVATPGTLIGGLRGVSVNNLGANNAVVAASTPVIGDTFQLKLNGHDRFAARNVTYFTQTQISQHHTGFGGTTYGCIAAGAVQLPFNTNSIAVYSFALKPEEHQPSGTCNFSRIDNAQLFQGQPAPIALHVYAINYNVLRIMSGMGGLAYSN